MTWLVVAIESEPSSLVDVCETQLLVAVAQDGKANDNVGMSEPENSLGRQPTSTDPKSQARPGKSHEIAPGHVKQAALDI